MAASSSSLGSSAQGAETCDLTGLASFWDGLPEVREQLRSGAALFSVKSEKNMDIRTPSAHVPVLKPILQIMREHNNKLPSIDAFREEIKLLYQLNKRELVTSEVEGSAWGLRKNAGFVKMKCRKRQPSSDSSRQRTA